jgi:hypothetical protein
MPSITTVPRNLAARSLVAFVCVLIAACGGGGGGSNSAPPPVSPPGALSYAGPQVYTVGVAITPLAPTVTGTVSGYAVSPALPPGLSLDAKSGQITGTPTSATTTANYTITASNSGGSSSFPLTISVNLAAPSGLAYPNPQTFFRGVAIATLIPAVQGTVAGYSVVPALPAGLSLDPISGQLSGTPTALSSAAFYAITAQNAVGQTSFSLSIAVVDMPPSALSYPSPQSYQTAAAIATISPSVTGVVTGYSVSPALPPGLSLDPATGRISGTPTQAAASAQYVVTASNSGGSTTFALAITVIIAPPKSLSYPTPVLFVMNAPMVPLPPTVQGILLHYSVASSLPPGVLLDATTGIISGTPTVAQAAASYTVTVSNSAGSTNASVSIGIVKLTVTPQAISRMVASGTPVTVAIGLKPLDFSFTGTLHARVTDVTGTFSIPATVGTASGGVFPVSLVTSTSAALGHVVDKLILNLYSDAAATVPQALRAISIPFDVHVLSSNSAWSGDNQTTLSAWPGVADWTTFQGNAAHTGYVDAAVDPNQFTTRWQGPPLVVGGLGGGFVQNNMSLTASNGQFFEANGNILYARNESDASVAWQYDFSSLEYPSTNPPAVANGVVYIAAGQQSSTYMFALRASNGGLVFKSQMSSQWEHYLAPTIGASGVYTNAGEYGGLYGFDTSGNQLFFGNLPQQDEWTPAVDANSVYAYTGDGLHMFDPVTGAVQMSITDPTFTNYVYDIGGSVVLGAAGHAVAGAYTNSLLNGCGIGNTLVGFNTTLGTINWKVPGCFPSNPAYHAGLLYVANENPVRLEVRSEADGSIQWSWIPPVAGDTNFLSEALLTQNMVFISTNTAVYGIDTTTHQTVWSYPAVGGARLALSANGILYLQFGANGITAINVK